jgi:hypothetical protein
VRPVRHSPPYVAELGRSWRIVVPIAGKLSPRVMSHAFPNRAAATAFLASQEGQAQVEQERGRPPF